MQSLGLSCLLPKMGAGRAKHYPHYQGCALAKHMLWGRMSQCLGAFGGCFPNLHRKIAVELNVEVERVESIFESNRWSCQAVGWSSRPFETTAIGFDSSDMFFHWGVGQLGSSWQKLLQIVSE